jgi:hypothetical protein
MERDWEKVVKAKFREMQDLLPENLQIVGVAVENVDAGEGAPVERNSLAPEFADVTEADIRQDIMNDATSQYKRVYDVVFNFEKDAK